MYVPTFFHTCILVEALLHLDEQLWLLLFTSTTTTTSAVGIILAVACGDSVSGFGRHQTSGASWRNSARNRDMISPPCPWTYPSLQINVDTSVHDTMRRFVDSWWFQIVVLELLYTFLSWNFHKISLLYESVKHVFGSLFICILISTVLKPPALSLCFVWPVLCGTSGTCFPRRVTVVVATSEMV